MKIRALTSFCGALSMAINEVDNCDNEIVVKDLLKAGYVEQVEEPPVKENVKKNETKQDNKK